MLIAPCTMDMIAKLAHGFTDDPVSLVTSAIDRNSTPVLIAPSMNATMFEQPATQRNLLSLTDDGFTVLDSGEGWQACRATGQGRLLEPEVLLDAVSTAIAQNTTVSY